MERKATCHNMSEKNRLYYGDNLSIMQEMVDKSIDLIYLDPPFNSKANYNVIYGQDQDKTQSEAFHDIWYWDAQSKKLYNSIVSGESKQQTAQSICTIEGLRKILGSCGMLSYLLYMQVRLLEMHRLLKDTGSLYLHCDPTASHFLKVVLDSIFEGKNFRNEIIWHYTGGGRSKNYFSKKHDIIFYYRKSKQAPFCLDSIRVPYKESSSYAKSGIVSQTGKHYMPHPKGTPVDDVWEIPIINPMSKERLGYATQKPRKLLERIIKASTHRGDVVMDPFCGCGTTLDAAESLERKWTGIDVSYLAVDTIEYRLKDRYEDHIKSTYEVLGTPTSLQAAEDLLKRTLANAYSSEPKNLEEAVALAEREGTPGEKYGKHAGRFEFQRWACSLIGATPNDREIGDQGVDGKLKWATNNGNEYVIGAVQVKSSTKVTANDLRALKGVISNGDGYICGVLISLYKSETEEFRQICGGFDKPTWTHYTGNEYPRLQLFSIEEYFEGLSAKIPTPIRPYRSAEIEEMKVEQAVF